jgi:predicted RNA-binding protein YlqC (UPF0109 family)
MKELLNYILTNILKDPIFTIEESEEEGRVTYTIETPPDNMGLIIGKGGKTIKAIQDVLRIRATLDNKVVFVNVVEKI